MPRPFTSIDRFLIGAQPGDTFTERVPNGIITRTVTAVPEHDSLGGTRRILECATVQTRYDGDASAYESLLVGADTLRGRLLPSGAWSRVSATKDPSQTVDLTSVLAHGPGAAGLRGAHRVARQEAAQRLPEMAPTPHVADAERLPA